MSSVSDVMKESANFNIYLQKSQPALVNMFQTRYIVMKWKCFFTESAGVVRI